MKPTDEKLNNEQEAFNAKVDAKAQQILQSMEGYSFELAAVIIERVGFHLQKESYIRFEKE
jgi:hypothetical protein